MTRSPIDILIDRADLRCTVCNAKAGTCDCWTKCPAPWCPWSFLKDTECGNPEHAKAKDFVKRHRRKRP